MGFLLRQGKTRMELAVGLLILIGTMLEGSEGLRCYQSEGPKRGISVKCRRPYSNCGKQVVDGQTVARGCFGLRDPACTEKVAATKADGCLTPEDEELVRDCIRSKPRSVTQSTSEDSLPSQDGTYTCYCWTDNCNPAGRSSPNKQVILGSILGAVLLSTFNILLGSF